MYFQIIVLNNIYLHFVFTGDLADGSFFISSYFSSCAFH